EHHVGPAAETGRLDRREHVNVIVSGATGAVRRQEYLPYPPSGIYRPAKNHAAAKVNRSYLVKTWCDGRVLCVTRANAPKLAAGVSTADKEVAVGVHVEPSQWGIVGDINRSLPGGATIDGPAELSGVASEDARCPILILETVTHAGGGAIDREPLLVATATASLAREQRPGLAAVCRAPQVVAVKREVDVRLETEIEKGPCLIGV